MKHPAAPAARRLITAALHPASVDPTAAAASISCASVSSAVLWRLLHGLGCLLAALLGFRCSRFLFFLLFSVSTPSHPLRSGRFHSGVAFPQPSLPPPSPPPPSHSSQVVVGRHGILVRPWPYPNPTEVSRAHRILARVQEEQRRQYGPVQNSRPLLVITPTYPRTFQALHLTGLVHCLKNVPYPLTWLVVEAGGPSNETAALLTRSGLSFLHLPFRRTMPSRWFDRHSLEAGMRLHALRVIKIQRLDGIVVFADDSNVHSLELFDEVQKVNWMGALSVGILAQSSNTFSSDDEKGNLPVPVQGPACNSSGQLIGWHTFNSLPYENDTATSIGDQGTVLPWKMEWSGFVMNSRLLWKQAEGKPNWVKDLDEIGKTGEQINSPLDLLKDEAYIEPLGNCGKQVLLWWLRVEARYDSKFPPGWAIDPPLEIVVPSKRTTWAEVLPEITSLVLPEEPENTKHSRRSGRSSKRSSRSKRKQKLHNKLESEN